MARDQGTAWRLHFTMPEGKQKKKVRFGRLETNASEKAVVVCYEMETL